MDRFSANVKRFRLFIATTVSESLRVFRTQSANLFFQSIALGFLIGAVLMASLVPGTALADAGGFPTRTPTIPATRTVTANLPPTVMPTATSTSLPTLTPLAFTSGQDSNQQVIPPTQLPIPPEPGGGGVGCWPFALLIILAVILGITYYFTRRAHTEEESIQ